MQVSFGAIQRFCLFVGTIVLLNLSGCAGSHRTDIARTLRSEFSAPEGSPQIIAAYQPWFGRSGHIDVGYNSQDSNVLAQQVEHAKDLNIKAFVVNWYGPSHDFEDRSYAALQRVSSEHGFKTAIMYDESVDDPSRATQQAISDLQYAYEHYIGPKSSMPAGAYLSYDGRPMIFVFPKSGDTDWKRVKQAVDGWEHPPILLYEDQDAKDWGAFDGYYAWVSPGKKGWAHDGSNWGRNYLESFYQRLSGEPDKVAVGAAWPNSHYQVERHRLRQNPRRLPQPSPPLLPRRSPATVPHDRYLERLRGRNSHRTRHRRLRRQDRNSTARWRIEPFAVANGSTATDTNNIHHL